MQAFLFSFLFLFCVHLTCVLRKRCIYPALCSLNHSFTHSVFDVCCLCMMRICAFVHVCVRCASCLLQKLSDQARMEVERAMPPLRAAEELVNQLCRDSTLYIHAFMHPSMHSSMHPSIYTSIHLRTYALTTSLHTPQYVIHPSLTSIPLTPLSSLSLSIDRLID